MAASRATEAKRQLALARYRIAGTAPEAEFDDVARHAATALEAPLAYVSFVDADTQHFKARAGFDLAAVPRAGSFCEHTVKARHLTVVPDALLDGRFAAHPMVAAAPHLRFYAGAPIVTDEGAAIGTVCVMDVRPRTLTDSQAEVLDVLARQTLTLLELRRERALRDAVTRALATDVRRQVEQLGSIGGDLLRRLAQDRDGLAAAVRVLGATEAISGTLDDIAGASSEPAGRLEELDLAELLAGLAATDEGDAFPISVTGDCSGRWDRDAISQAVGRLVEQHAAHDGFSVRLRGNDDVVELTLLWKVPVADGAASWLRVEALRRVVERHGGAVAETDESLRVSLPRAT